MSEIIIEEIAGRERLADWPAIPCYMIFVKDENSPPGKGGVQNCLTVTMAGAIKYYIKERNITIMNKEKAITANGEIPANAGTITGNISEEKALYSVAGVKGTIAEKEVQEALKQYVYIPERVIVKEARKSYKPEGADTTTQKVKVMSGTTLEDAIFHELSLVGIELDPVKAINKKYRIVDYTLGLEGNMSGGRFTGYAATGFKLTVTKLEEIKGE